MMKFAPLLLTMLIDHSRLTSMTISLRQRMRQLHFDLVVADFALVSSW